MKNSVFSGVFAREVRSAFPSREGSKMRKSMVIITLAGILVGASSLGAAQAKPAWQADIVWAKNDTGAPDCPWLYGPPLSSCLAIGLATGNHAGNRQCVIDLSIGAAKSGNDQVAFGWTLVTQCHNPPEVQNLLLAGPQAVADYLRSF
jgi:hypothetical protein